LPYEQRTQASDKAASRERLESPGSSSEVESRGARNPELRGLDYAAGAAALSPNKGPGLSEAKKLELMRAAAESIRKDYAEYWIPSGYSYAHMQMRDERQELAAEGLITNTVQTVSGTTVPDVGRWKHVISLLELAQNSMAAGDVALGLRQYKMASHWTTKNVREWGRYTGSTAGSLDTAVTVTRVTRDIAFAATATLAAVVLAPIIVPSLIGAGASGAATTAVTVGVGAGVGGTVVAVGRGTGDMLGQLLATGEVNWSDVGDNTWDGFKKGAIDGGFALLSAAPAVNKLAGLSPRQLALQTGNRFRQAAVTAMRTGAKETTISALQTMSEEALEFATSTDFREKWSKDPAAAFAEFRTKLVASGASSFVGGSITGGMGRGNLDASELRRVGEREAAQTAARNLGYKGFQAIEGSARDACTDALKGLPVAAAKSVTSFCLTRLQDGKPVTAKDISLELYKLGLGRAVSGSTGTVDTAAVDLANALGEIQRSR
jgi:hypothetical protein